MRINSGKIRNGFQAGDEEEYISKGCYRVEDPLSQTLFPLRFFLVPGFFNTCFPVSGPLGILPCAVKAQGGYPSGREFGAFRFTSPVKRAPARILSLTHDTGRRV